MPSAYRIHGTTPKGDKRLQCKSCRKTFSLGSSRRRQKETTETTLVLKLLVNQTGLKRITEITGIPATRLYNRIDFLAEQCRYLANHKERNIAKEFAGRNRVIATDVQTLLANWRHADRILNVPVQHAASVERDTGYALAATTDYDPDTDPVKMEQQMSAVGDFLVPRAWRKHGRVWSFEEYQDSVLRGVGNILSEEEQC